MIETLKRIANLNSEANTLKKATGIILPQKVWRKKKARRAMQKFSRKQNHR